MKINNIEMIEEMNREMIECNGDGEVGLEEYMIGMYGYGMGERLDERLKMKVKLRRDVKKMFDMNIGIDMNRECVYMIED